MIGSSRTLCYPQIGSPNLFWLRALNQICPLTKHNRLVGTCPIFRQFPGFKLVPSKWRSLVPPTSG